MVLGGDPLSGSSSKGLILDMNASTFGRPFEVSLRGGSPSVDLVGMGKEAIELRMSYPSEIRSPSIRVRSQRVVQLGGSTRWGHLIESFLIRSCIGHLVDLVDKRGAPWPPRQPGYHRRM